MSSIEILQSIIDDISAGFDALLEELDTQKKVELDLRQKLVRAVDRVSRLRLRTPPLLCLMLQTF